RAQLRLQGRVGLVALQLQRGVEVLGRAARVAVLRARPGAPGARPKVAAVERQGPREVGGGLRGPARSEGELALPEQRPRRLGPRAARRLELVAARGAALAPRQALPARDRGQQGVAGLAPALEGAQALETQGVDARAAVLRAALARGQRPFGGGQRLARAPGAKQGLRERPLSRERAGLALRAGLRVGQRLAGAAQVEPDQRALGQETGGVRLERDGALDERLRLDGSSGPRERARPCAEDTRGARLELRGLLEV